MEKLNRLNWRYGFFFSMYGSRIGIRTNTSDVLERIEKHLPPGACDYIPKSPFVRELYSLCVPQSEEQKTVRRYNLLYRGTGRLARTVDLDELFDIFEADLNYAVAYMARYRLPVNAGVVGWKNRAIIILSAFGGGKTELVKALVDAGATYYSDAYAMFDKQGRVHPYHKPLFIRQGGSARFTRLPVEALGGKIGTTPLPVRLLAITEYVPEAQWKPHVVSPARTVLTLLDKALGARTRPEEAMSVFQQVAQSALTLKGKRGDAQFTAAQLLRRVDELLAHE